MGDAIKKLVGDTPDVESQWVVKRHPLLCGLMAFHLDLNMWEGGMQLANQWASIHNVMHLYNAVKQQLGLADWADMEFIIEQHTAEHLFYGGRPKKPDEYATRMQLASGASIQNFAENRHSKQKLSSRGFAGAVRQLRLESATSEVFHPRYHTMGCVWELNPEPPSCYEILSKFYKRPVKTVVKRGNKEANDAVKLLWSLRTGLDEEALHLHFDYMAMHERCWEFLRHLRTSLHADFEMAKDVAGEDYTRKEDDLRDIVGYILQVVESTSKHTRRDAQSLPLKRLATLLERVKGVMQPFIEKEGGVELDRAKAAVKCKPRP